MIIFFSWFFVFCAFIAQLTCCSPFLISGFFFYLFKLIISVQFSHSFISDLLQPYGLQHTRPPCPSQLPEPTQTYVQQVSDAIQPFFSCLQSFPASGSFQMSQLFASGGQSIGVSASTSVVPKNTQYWSSPGWIGWISLQSKGLSRVFSNTTAQKHQFFGAQLSSPSYSHIHTWLLVKP